MIGVDTNVIVRHILQDDAQQSPLASRFLAARTADDPAYVSTAVVLELIWTLRRRYDFTPLEVSRIVSAMTRSRDLVLEDRAAVRRAIWDAEDANGDIADAIIAHSAIDAGCDGVVTFDRRAQRLPGMLPVG